MNFSEQNTPAQNSLPQFSEISVRTNIVTTSNYASSGSNELQAAAQSTVYTTAADTNNAKQILINTQNKYSTPILNWPDHSTLLQLCEKQGLQTINIPAYTQNSSPAMNQQSHHLPMRIIPNVYVTHENLQNKIDADSLKNGNEDINSGTSSSLPLTLQQLIKIQSEQVKKEKLEEHKNDQIQNNILNIPNVPIYKTTQMQNDNQYMNGDLHHHHQILSLNPSDVNVHMEDSPENHNGTPQGQVIHVAQVIGSPDNKMDQQVLQQQQQQTDPPKPEKKIKFRAKTGEIKITIALDGSTLYCCPECSLAFTQKSEIEQHLQIHVQERKYQCKECGAMLKRKEHLDQHMRGHSDERPFKCPVCQKAFKRNEHLTRHYVIHSGDKNFTCQVCQKAFSRKDHLNKHTQTHLGIKKTKSKRESIQDPLTVAIATTTTTSNSSSSGIPTTDPLNTTAAAASMLLRTDINNILKEGNIKQENTHFLQHIQNLQKDSNLMQTFSAFKEHMLKDGSTLQQQAVNMNEILPQNTRYLMPS